MFRKGGGLSARDIRGRKRCRLYVECGCGHVFSAEFQIFSTCSDVHIANLAFFVRACPIRYPRRHPTTQVKKCRRRRSATTRRVGPSISPTPGAVPLRPVPPQSHKTTVMAPAGALMLMQAHVFDNPPPPSPNHSATVLAWVLQLVQMPFGAIPLFHHPPPTHIVCASFNARAGAVPPFPTPPASKKAGNYT